MSCISGKVLANKLCLGSCPGGSYDNNGICSPCASNCETCSPLITCLSCSASYFFSENHTCELSCLNGRIADSTSRICCHSSCRTCDNLSDTSCLSCNGTRGFYQKKCLDNCPPGTLLQANICVAYQCDASCNTCSGPDANQCLSCSGNKGLHLGICKNPCPSGTLLQANICVPYSCEPSCATCSGPDANQCLSCNGNRGLHLGICKNPCPPGTVFLDNNCPNCSQNCLTCSGKFIGKKLFFFDLNFNFLRYNRIM